MKAVYLDQNTRSIADLVEIDPNLYLVTRINVPTASRAKGFGSKLLREIIEDADREGTTLEIHPVPSGGMTRKELISWYRRHGFQWEQSRASPGDPIKVLIREPGGTCD